MAEAEVKEIQSDWVLITYDIPVTAEPVRHKFLKQAAALGAVQHTESVYILPYSDTSFALANELAQVADVIIWKSHQEDKEKAAAITESYEDHLKVRCDEIEQRLSISQDFITGGQLGVAARMGIKTLRLLKQLDKISQSFNPPWLKGRLEELAAKWSTIYGAKEEKK